MDNKVMILLIIGILVMIAGLIYVGSWVHHYVTYYYTSKPIVIDNGTIFVSLDFNAVDAFVAQNSMYVSMQVDEPSLIYPNGTIIPRYHPLSNELRHGSYNLIIIDAKNSAEPFPITTSNYTGALITPIDYKQKPVLHVKGNSTVTFPIAGDYTAYLLVTYQSHPELDIPLGRVMNVSPVETSLQVASNNNSSGFSMIVVGLAIVQIGLAVHTRKKDIPYELTNNSMGAPPQGSGIPPEFYDNIQKIKESSERLEKSTKYLTRYTYAILGATLIMTGIAIATALHLFK